MQVGDIRTHNSYNAKTGERTQYTDTVTQEEVDAYNAQIAEAVAKAMELTELEEVKTNVVEVAKYAIIKATSQDDIIQGLLSRIETLEGGSM